jgi:tetratricopeptide (TPR) repeat protein
MTLALRAGAVLGLALTCAAAQAQTDSSTLQESLDAEARAIYQAGVVAYRDGRFEAAERYFRQAYEASGRAQLLYNVALSAEQARHDEAALEAYQAYLDQVPDAPQQTRVETRIAALQAMLAERPAPAAEAPPEPEPEAALATSDEAAVAATDAPPADEASSGGAGPLPWIVIGASAAVAVAGGVLLGVGLADVSTVENAAPPSTWADVEGAYDRAPVLTGIGIAALGVGLAGAAVGVVLAVAGGGDEQSPTAGLRVGPASLRLEGSF